MTIEELTRLTDEELCRHCAELCGWKTHLAGDGVIYWIDPAAPNCYGAEPPNYPADLNAMHEAEKMLSGPEWLGYMSFLEPMAEDNGPGFMIHATARQRCIAFILTKQQS